MCGKLKHMLPLTLYFSTTITLHPHILWFDNGIFPAEIQFAISVPVHENVGTLTFCLKDISSIN